MTTEIFTVLDMVAQLYLEPFFAPNIEYAIRTFGEAAGKEGHQFAKYPEDYALFHIGSFDASLGVITSAEPRKIAVAVQFTGPNLEVDV